MAEPGISYLTIGEVLGLLLDEFPDVTISKIRFLESQGLIEPERTASGYRKFLEHDVELLRVILREQRQNFLPLRVIKDRLDSGEIEPSGTPPRGTAIESSDGEDTELPSASVVAGHPAARRHGLNRTVSEAPASVSNAAASTRPDSRSDDRPARTPAPTAIISAPATSGPARTPSHAANAPDATTPGVSPASSESRAPASSPRLLPGVVVNRDELCAMASVSREQLAALEEYGVIAKRRTSTDLYGEDAVEIAAAAGGFLRAGVDARHLRAWRTSVEREVGLYEQLVVPLLRQRNPQSRAQAAVQLDELHGLGSKLRNALMRSAVRQQFEL